jgi:hypothetical protein
MANKDQPIGFEPHGKVLRAQSYKTSAVVYPGDLVKLANDGTVIQIAATEASIGAALTYAASGAQVLVADDPQQLFVAQADDATIDAQTDLILNASVVVGSPNATYKRSGMQVDASTVAVTQGLELKIIAVKPRVDNALGSKVDVVCKINQHQLANNTAGV